jgi:hypothetical protein
MQLRYFLLLGALILMSLNVFAGISFFDVNDFNDTHFQVNYTCSKDHSNSDLNILDNLDNLKINIKINCRNSLDSNYFKKTDFNKGMLSVTLNLAGCDSSKETCFYQKFFNNNHGPTQINISDNNIFVLLVSIISLVFVVKKLN